MTVTALVMAGGKGTRMKSEIEKPLIPLKGKPMILHIITALKNATMVDGILVSVSPNTPQTSQKMRDLGVRVVETSGKNYILDMQTAIKKEGLKKTLILSADLPLLASTLIDQLIRYYEATGKPALTVMAPLESYRRLKLDVGMKIKINEKTLVPVGINFVDGAFIDQPEIEEEILIMKNPRIILNVNTLEELKRAEKHHGNGEQIRVL